MKEFFEKATIALLGSLKWPLILLLLFFIGSFINYKYEMSIYDIEMMYFTGAGHICFEDIDGSSHGGVSRIKVFGDHRFIIFCGDGSAILVDGHRVDRSNVTPGLRKGPPDDFNQYNYDPSSKLPQNDKFIRP